MNTATANSGLAPGDVAACYGADPISRLISYGTASLVPPMLGPSHVAFITDLTHGGRPLWVESTTSCRRRCLINGTTTRGAQAHDPERRIQDYCQAGGRVDIYSPTDLRHYSPAELRRIREILIARFVRNNIHYDLRGAIISGTRLLRLLPGDDIERLFCSELIAAMLAALGRLNNGIAGRYSPQRLIRELVRTGVYEFSHSYQTDKKPVQKVPSTSAVDLSIKHRK